MKLNKTLLSIAVALTMVAGSANAMSHRHAARLEAQGCTQVQEAEGTCGKSPKVNEADAMAAARAWDEQHSAAPVQKRHAAPRIRVEPQTGYRCDEPLPVDADNSLRRWADHNCL